MVYKVMVDLDKVDLNKLMALVKKEGVEFCVADDSLFFHVIHTTPTKISNLMKRVNTSGFVIKQLTERPVHPDESFSQLWCFEKFNEDETRKFEEEHQTELQKMADNIEKIRQGLIKDNLLKEKEEPNKNG